jgi:catechol 2,3-dioxygenase
MTATTEATSSGPRAGLRRTLLSHIVLRTRNPERMAAFYERAVGLNRHPPAESGSIRLGWHSGSHVLELAAGDPGLESFGLEIGDDGGVTALASGLADRGYELIDLNQVDDAIGVRDPHGTLVVLHGPIDRSGEHAADPGRRPVRLQHITLATQDVEPAVGFYRALGFRVSDRMGDRFTWLRSNVEHHSVAIVRSDSPTRLDHFSFDVRGWSDFKDWCDRLTDLGVPVVWGPGRHGPGNNLFIVFDDPDGNHVELSAEMERYWDDFATYPPRQWDVTPYTANLWGGQLPSWRDAG